MPRRAQLAQIDEVLGGILRTKDITKANHTAGSSIAAPIESIERCAVEMASEKKHLSVVLEGDESEDSGHTVLFEDAESSCSTSQAGPSGRRRRTRREGLVSNGISEPVLAVLDAKVTLDKQVMTILEAADSNSTAGEPSAELVRAVDRAVERQQLSLALKRELFGVVAWRFRCVDCSKRHWADQYESSSFILWNGSGERPQLRSGPCLGCKEAARQGRKDGDIVTYTL
ncbi:hypothetical protein HJFPF1_08069 [Paramyrothecium foliicola]|nr:hypothetical protein HJFPF1_08069 [Paramyrothecium foliicola]